MALSYNVIKFTNGKSCVIFDQRTMYAVGPDSSVQPTLSVGTLYRFRNAYLFYASGGVILYMVQGTDTAGNVYKYKDETEAGVGNAGYYINNYKVCAFTPGLGGVFRVCFMIATDGTKYVIRLNWTSSDHGDFINGSNLSDEHFTDNIAGWGRMVKVNFSGSSGTIELRVNDPAGVYGSNYYRVFEWGQSYTSYTPISNLDPQPADDDFEPYTPGGYAGEGGGSRGNFSEDSGHVSRDALPSISAVGSGFSTLFIPTRAQLQRLSQTFWGSTIVGFFQNAITNIKDMFVSLGILPFVAPSGATVNVSWLDIATIDIPLTLASDQFVELDMGRIDLGNDPYIFSSDSVLDYSPYSKLGIYLPFIGYQELDIDECRDSVLGLVYRVDIMSGSCIAIISINGNDIYQFSGNCLTQIPLTSADMTGLLSGSVQVAVAAASMGASAAVASAGDAVSAEMAGKGKISASQLEMQNAQHEASVSNAKGSLVSATANGMMGMKPNFKKSGAVSASVSLLNVKQPYLFLKTPRQSYPEDYGHYCGFPANITGKLSDFSGYTVVEDIRLNGLVATSSEVEEIYNLLKSGVIV